jgi:flagellar basal body-associated protein FliL
MAEAKAKEPPAPESAPAPVKSGRSKTLMIVGAMMLVEAVGVFYVANLLSSEPSAAEAGPVEDTSHNDAQAEAPGNAHGAPSAGEAHGGGHGSGHGGDAHAAGAAKTAATTSPHDNIEIEVADCRPHNNRAGKLITCRIRVSILVSGSDAERAKALVESRKSRIQDRVNYVIRSVEPKFLNEPALATIKRGLKQELGEVLGDPDIIKEILIPELLQSG